MSIEGNEAGRTRDRCERAATRSRRTGRFRRATAILKGGLLVVGVPLGMLLGVCASSAASAAQEASPAELDPPKTWHASAFVRGRMGIRVIDYWSEGAKMRAHTLIGGHPITTIVNDDRYIVIDHLAGRGLDVQRSKKARKADRKRGRPFAFELDELIRDGGERIDEVEIGSMKAEIWRVTDGFGRRKVWVTAQMPRVPLRIETFTRVDSGTIDVDYSNWTFDLEMPKHFFKRPSGYEIDRFDYDDFVERSAKGPVSRLPILYPDLLHGDPS